jgi:predicted Zn-dependent protease with MMP-like domain
MDREIFEKLVEHAFERLPDRFKEAIENVGIVVEDYPSDEIVKTLGLRSRDTLLGLYQGIPHSSRTTWYGMTPVVPDRISLFKPNIEARQKNDDEIERAIYDVLVHEIGHYFGMNEEEIRAAGY